MNFRRFLFISVVSKHLSTQTTVGTVEGFLTLTIGTMSTICFSTVIFGGKSGRFRLAEMAKARFRQKNVEQPT